MGLFDKFKSSNEDDYLEIDHPAEEKSDSPLSVEIEKIETLEDADRIQQKIRDGNKILVVKIQDLKNRDMAELRRAIERVKRTCKAVNGDIAGLGEDWIIVTDSTASVERTPTVV